MQKSVIRSIVGMGLILGHVIAFFMIFYRLDAYTPTLEAKLGLVLSIAPITGAFALAATRHIISAQSTAAEVGNYDKPFSLLAVLLPMGFVMAIVFELGRYPYGVSKDLEGLRLSLGILETGLGLVVGVFVEELFGVKLATVKDEIISHGAAEKK